MVDASDNEAASARTGAHLRVPSIVAIGNFDGVHLGHREVLAQARSIADARGLALIVLTFDPHPRAVLGKEAPAKLTTLAQRVELLTAAGVDRVVVEPFTKQLASWSPERFATELLVGRLDARAVVVGENFRFGANRSGDFVALHALGAKLGFEAVAASVFGDADGPLSSTRVRNAIAGGDVTLAARLLGRWHVLSGIVEHGDALGRTLGFPTANLGHIEALLPKYGVYAVRVRSEGDASWHAGVMNVGMRPTLAGNALRVEVHVLDYEGDLYGQKLHVALVQRIRDELKFDGLPALRAQIGRDIERAREVLSCAGQMPS